jgi:hypothetical protein
VTGLHTALALLGVGVLLYALSLLGVHLANRPPRPPRKATMTTPTPNPFNGLRDAFRESGRLLAAWQAPAPARLPLSRHAVIALVLGLCGLGFIGIVFAVDAVHDVYRGHTARGRVVAAAALVINILVNLAWLVCGVLLMTGWAR